MHPYREKLLKALKTLDMVWARKAMPLASSDYVRLIALHKGRVACLDMDTDLRAVSVEWLTSRGYALKSIK